MPNLQSMLIYYLWFRAYQQSFRTRWGVTNVCQQARVITANFFTIDKKDITQFAIHAAIKPFFPLLPLATPLRSRAKQGSFRTRWRVANVWQQARNFDGCNAILMRFIVYWSRNGQSLVFRETNKKNSGYDIEPRRRAESLQ